MPTSPLLPPNWDLPEEIVNRLGRRAGRQRAMFADGHLLLILHRVPGEEHLERKSRFFWRSPEGIWSSSDLGPGVEAVQKHLNEYATAKDTYEDAMEAAHTAEGFFHVLEDLAPVLRSSRNLHAALQEARNLDKTDRDIISLRDQAYDVERAFDLLYTETKHAQELAVARRTEDLARASHAMSASAHRLNILAAFFFPVATLATIFGTNLQHGFEAMWAPGPFLLMVLLGLLTGLALKSWIAGKSKSSNGVVAKSYASRRW